MIPRCSAPRLAVNTSWRKQHSAFPKSTCASWREILSRPHFCLPRRNCDFLISLTLRQCGPSHARLHIMPELQNSELTPKAELYCPKCAAELSDSPPCGSVGA